MRNAEQAHVVEDTMDLFLGHEKLVLRGKNLNEVARNLCTIFAEEEVPLSGRQAKLLLRRALKQGTLRREYSPNKENKFIGVRTLSAAERNQLNARRKRSERRATSKRTPSFRNEPKQVAA